MLPLFLISKPSSWASAARSTALPPSPDTKKYIWLSSVNYDQGVSSGSPVHVIGDLHAERVYLTEGALKGTIAHYLSSATFVCVAGVNQYRNLKPVLERMKGYGMKQLLGVHLQGLEPWAH